MIDANHLFSRYTPEMDLDVLLPFHRVDKYFDQAIQSLADSQKIELNIILIDDRLDRSENVDKRLSVLKKYSIVKTAGGTGYGNALELGSQLLESDAVALFNSDDLVHPMRFRKQMESLQNCDLVLTKMQRINRAGTRIPSLTGDFNSPNYDPFYLLFGSYGANATWCMQTTWWSRNAFFDDEACLDWRIALNALTKTKIGYLPEDLYFYRKHPNQITNSKAVTELNMTSTYILWSKLIQSYGFGSYSYEIFKMFAAPWIIPSFIDPREVKSFVTEISSFSLLSNSNLEESVDSLIQRRLLFALRTRSKPSFKLWLGLKGMKQIPFLGKDLIASAFINHFVD